MEFLDEVFVFVWKFLSLPFSTYFLQNFSIFWTKVAFRSKISEAYQLFLSPVKQANSIFFLPIEIQSIHTKGSDQTVQKNL